MSSNRMYMYGVAGLVGVAATSAYAYLVHCGLHHKVVFTEQKYPLDNITIYYKFATGPYCESGVHFQTLDKLVPGTPTIGLYYDDCRTVKPKDCRYVVAAIVSEGKQDADLNVITILENSGYKKRDLPKAEKALVTRFPLKSFVSIILSVRKVWPTLATYYKENPEYPVPKIWCSAYKQTEAVFMGLLDDDINEFYVEEAREYQPSSDAKKDD